MKKKRLHWTLKLLIVLVVLLGALYLGARWYLSSDAVAQQLKSRLQESLSAPIDIGSVSVGILGGSSVKDLKVYETETAEKPWLTIDQVSVDVSALDIVKKKIKPQLLTLTGAHVHLQFSKDRQLLTKLPTVKAQSGEPMALPKTILKKSRFTLSQDGYPPLEIQGIEAEVRGEGESKKLNGTIEDPYWGKWSVEGSLEAKKARATLILRAPAAEVTQAKLEKLPFVPFNVWEQVQKVQGIAQVELLIRMEQGQDVHYRVSLQARDTRLFVSSLSLQAHQARGEVIVEDNLVQLRDVRGSAAGGEIATTGDLDFRKEPSRLEFHVEVKNAALKQLPSSWKLPEAIQGDLNGKADLVVTIGEKVTTQGSGKGQIENATIAGAKTTGPIELKLVADENGFHFPMPTPQTSLSLPRAWAPLTILAEVDGIEEEQQLPLPLPKWLPSLDQVRRAPIQLLSTMHRAVDQMAKTAARMGTTFVRYIPNQQRAQGNQPPTYLQANFGLKDVDLARLLDNLGVKPPVPVQGKGSVQVQVAIPVDTPKDLKLYRIQGTVKLEALSLAEVKLDQLEGRIALANGILTMEDLKGTFPGMPSGEVLGSAKLQLEPQGDLTAKLNLKKVLLERFAGLLPKDSIRPQGEVSGTITFQAPADKLQDTSAWIAKGDLKADKVRAGEWQLGQTIAKLDLKNGRLKIEELTSAYKDFRLNGSGHLDLKDNYPFTVSLGIKESEISELVKLSPEIKIPVEVKGKVTLGLEAKGALQPFRAEVVGKASSPGVEIAALKFDSLSFDWKASEKTVEVSNLRGELYKGTVSGQGTAPIDARAAGSFRLQFDKVDLGAMASSFPAFPVPLQGRAEGSLNGTISADTGKGRSVVAKTDLKSDRIVVQRIPAESLTGTIQYRQSQVIYQLEGKTLGGTFDVNGIWPAPASPGDEPPKKGKASLKNLELGELGEAFGPGAALRPLRGRLNLELDYDHDPDSGFPVGSGTISVEAFRWGRRDLSRRVRGRIRVSRQAVQLIDLEGDLAGGSLLAILTLDLTQWERSRYRIRLSRADATRLLSPFLEDLPISGPLNVTVRGTMGREWRGRGQLMLQDGKLSGAPVREWRAPFDFTYAPARGNGEIAIRDSNARIAQGRAVGQATFRLGLSTRLESKIRFFGVDLQRLLRSSTVVKRQLGRGRVSGWLELKGRDVRSVKDLTGRLEVEFRQTQALTFPILSDVAPFLRGQSIATTFQRGMLMASLARGIVRVKALLLESDLIQLASDGTITLEQGRLNLSVTIRTGNVFIDPTILRLVGLAVGTPLGAEVLIQVATYLSNRVLHLRVRGTLKNPTVRLEPLRILSEEAVRFLIRSQLPAPTPGP